MTKKEVRALRAKKLRNFLKKETGIRISLPLSFQFAKAWEKEELPTFLTDKNLIQIYDLLYKVHLDNQDYWNYRPTKLMEELNKVLKEVG
ncbi:MAG TPA: hypothetical protein ENG63_06385 [Candidatus Desulfofervidus auxilii]|uniref:Uncharacterized protein n=1 Tax=Desulfofervidus auxilii TaxID=1621989 RepID=A0A7C0Y5Y9_DESA2|nr:hypothetical protein [Candidatus Desulfofervidus auxilii]